MVNNIPKVDNNTIKIQAAKQTYSKQMLPQKLNATLNSVYAKQDFLFKVLASQVLAMAEQDNMNPFGRKINVLG